MSRTENQDTAFYNNVILTSSSLLCLNFLFFSSSCTISSLPLAFLCHFLLYCNVPIFHFQGEVFDYLVAHGRMKEKEARAKFRQVSASACELVILQCQSSHVCTRRSKSESTSENFVFYFTFCNISFADYIIRVTFECKSLIEKLTWIKIKPDDYVLQHDLRMIQTALCFSGSKNICTNESTYLVANI